jgi:hypothetical protein
MRGVYSKYPDTSRTTFTEEGAVLVTATSPADDKPAIAFDARVWPAAKLSVEVAVETWSPAVTTSVPAAAAATTVTFNATARAVGGTPQDEAGTSKCRVPPAAIPGAPYGPAGPRVSARRQGVSVWNEVGGVMEAPTFAVYRAVQSLRSVTVATYVPGQRPVSDVAVDPPGDQLTVSDPVPPVGETDAVPSQAKVEVASVFEPPARRAGGARRDAWAVAWERFSSVTVTV